MQVRLCHFEHQDDEERLFGPFFGIRDHAFWHVIVQLFELVEWTRSGCFFWPLLFCTLFIHR